MRLRDAVKTAISGLKHAKTRAVLTMLGIVIGIGSVILLMSIGTSAQRLIINQIQNIGSNLVFVIPGATKGSSASPPASVLGVVIKTLKKTDLESFQREAAVKAAAADTHGLARIVYGNNDVQATYSGVTGDYFKIINLKVREGQLLTPADNTALNKVAVIGPAMAETLFGETNPLGKYVRLKNLSFRVIGVLDKKGLGIMGADLDNMVFIPMSVAQKQLLGIDYYGSIMVQGADEYNIEFIKSRMTAVLRQNHNITNPDKDDFTIRTQEDALALLGSITSILKIFLAAIASISLVVGGIGIMNIMLVSVVERTREIGLRKAVGATYADIMIQFLWEAVMLTGIGGLIGIAGGGLLTALIYFVLKNVTDIGWVFALPFSSILLAFGVATLIGLAFGIYPARQAAKKSPIEALRYE